MTKRVGSYRHMTCPWLLGTVRGHDHSVLTIHCFRCNLVTIIFKKSDAQEKRKTQFIKTHMKCKEKK